jgi:hypothetical protein
MPEKFNTFKMGLMELLDGPGQTQLQNDLTAINPEKPMQLVRVFALASRRYPKSFPRQADGNRLGIPSHWRILDLTRVVLLLHAEQVFGNEFIPLLLKLLISTDADERSAANYCLPYLKPCDALHDIATETLRTNIKPVFESLAHFNPYTQTGLSEHAFNQMVLKALFIESALWPIQGLDERTNPHLARMLVDYMRERMAAGRVVHYELFRAIGSYLEESYWEAIHKYFLITDSHTRDAIHLFLRKNTHLPSCSKYIERLSGIASMTPGITWEALKEQYYAKRN